MSDDRGRTAFPDGRYFESLNRASTTKRCLRTQPIRALLARVRKGDLPSTLPLVA